MLIPGKAEENDTSEKRKPKPKIEFKSGPVFPTRKPAETKKGGEEGNKAKKTTVMNDLDAFFGEKTIVEDEKQKVAVAVARAVTAPESKKEPEKKEAEEEEEDVEYVYEEVEDDSQQP